MSVTVDVKDLVVYLYGYMRERLVIFSRQKSKKWEAPVESLTFANLFVGPHPQFVK